MTDDKIIKALECCGIDRCDDCPCWTEELSCDHNLELLALDLINRQKAEIERLNALIDAVEEHFNPLPFKNNFDSYIVKIKSEARKEFAESVDKLLHEHSRGDIDDRELYRLFGELKKEMENENGRT